MSGQDGTDGCREQIAQRDFRKDLLREAADHFVRLRGTEVRLQDFIALRRWLARSDAHREAFHRVREMWKAVESIRRTPAAAAVKYGGKRRIGGAGFETADRSHGGD